MASELSPHIERMIVDAVSTGLFPSREAVIEAGVERLLNEEPQFVPPEHLEAVERGLDQLDAELGCVWDVEDEIRRYHTRRAERNSGSG